MMHPFVGDSIKITWSHQNVKDVFRWVVYISTEASGNMPSSTPEPRNATLPASRTIKAAARRRQTAPPNETKEVITRIAISAVDRVGNESEPSYRDIIQFVPSNSR